MASAGLESGPRGSVSHADAMPAPARSTMTKLFRLLICSLQENASVATQKRLPNGQSSLKWRCSHTHTGWPFVCFQIRFVHEGRHLAIAVSGDDLYITAVSRAVDAATDGEGSEGFQFFANGDGPLDDGFSVADTLAHAKEFELRGPLTEADRKFSHVSKNCPDMEAL